MFLISSGANTTMMAVENDTEPTLRPGSRLHDV